MAKSVRKLLFSLVVCSLGSQAWAYSEFKLYKHNYFNWQLSLNYFFTEANYDRSNNQYDRLNNGNSYSILDADFGVRWTPNTRWGLYLQPRLTSAESRSSGNIRANSGLSQLVIGTDWLLYNENFQIIPDISATFPIATLDERADSVLLSEGAYEFKSLLRFQFYYSNFRVFSFIGYQHRDDERAPLLPLGAGMEFNFIYWNLGGKLSGYTPAGADRYTTNVAQREDVTARNGDSLKFNSVNPALLQADVWLRWQSQKRVGIELGGGSTLTGRSSAAGWNVRTTIIYEFDVPEKKKKGTKTEFKLDTEDGVDQSLFK